LADSQNLWREIRTDCFPADRSALFLDRDGTVIELVDYLADPAQVRLIGAAVAAIKEANRAGRAVVLVTNQSGVGRGYFGWDEFHAVQDRMHDLLKAEGAVIDAVYACPHPPPDAGGPPSSAYRKPAPGMLLQAAEDVKLDLSVSRIVGDGVSDLAAGKAAGLPSGVFVASGYGQGEREKCAALQEDSFRVLFASRDRWPVY
jgi:D-glycero-D-manno-heptose 1,7-bisphosphate phosphatase